MSEIVTLHENVVFRQQEGGYLGELPHGRAVSVRDDGTELVQGVVQVVHPPAFSCVDIQPHALPLTSRLRLWRAVEARRSGSKEKDRRVSAFGSFSVETCRSTTLRRAQVAQSVPFLVSNDRLERKQFSF